MIGLLILAREIVASAASRWDIGQRPMPLCPPARLGQTHRETLLSIHEVRERETHSVRAGLAVTPETGVLPRLAAKPGSRYAAVQGLRDPHQVLQCLKRYS